MSRPQPSRRSRRASRWSVAVVIFLVGLLLSSALFPQWRYALTGGLIAAIAAVLTVLASRTLKLATRAEVLGYGLWCAVCLLSYWYMHYIAEVGRGVVLLGVAGMCAFMLISRVARAMPVGDRRTAGLEAQSISWIGQWFWSERKSASRAVADASVPDLLEAWKKTLDTQMHFNEMLQRIRTIGLAGALTVSGAAVASLSQGKIFVLMMSGRHLYPAALFIQLCAVILLLGLMFFEGYFYSLLLGAVDFAEQIEEKTNIRQTQHISRSVPPKWAARRMSWFWYSAFIPSLFFAFFLFTAGGRLVLLEKAAKPMRVAVDMDGVVTDFVTPFLQKLNAQYGCGHVRSEITDYNFDKALRYSDGRCGKLVGALSGDFYYSLKPISGALEALVPWASAGDLTVVTSRPSAVEPETRRWLDEHGLARAVLVHTSSKTDCGRWDIFIEDSRDEALRLSGCADCVILLNAPWNQRSPLPRNVLRVADWNEATSVVRKYCSGSLP